MQSYKLRQIVSSSSSVRNQNVFGITIPNEVAIFFKETFFNIEKSGNAIVLSSGCNNIITKEEIKRYEYEDCRI